MRAVVFEGPRQLRMEMVPDPTPEDGGVVLKVRTCTICGTDLRIYEHGDPKIRPPQIIGHEIAGEIAAVGRSVEGWTEGARAALAPPGIACGNCAYCRRGFTNLCLNRRIIGYHLPGGFAEYVHIPAAALQQGLLVPIPDGVPFEAASLIEPLGCVVNAHERLDVGPGGTVVILGAGPIGLMHAQLSRIEGASRVILADISDERLRMAGWVEVDMRVNPKTDDLKQAVLDATDGLGADVIIVAVSSAEAQQTAVSIAAKRARISLFAGLPAGAAVQLDTNRVHYGELAIYGASASRPEHARHAASLIASGRFDAGRLVTHHVTLENIAEGFDLAGRRQSLKVCVDVG